MWFKQIQLFQLSDPIAFNPEELAAKLEPLAFTSCLPSFPSSMGWISPIDEEDAPLVQAANGFMMICLQIEEKILPASVIRQELTDKVKQIEATGERKVRQKEKLSLKDEITMTLLPRAFTKMTRIYAYIDTKNQWLVLATTQASKTEQFVSLFKRSISEGLQSFELKKVAPELTHWLKTQNYPTIFAIEKACVLQDPDQQNRIIRCQQQDLFAPSIQSLIKDGCQVKQLALCWHDRVNFMLADDFSLRSIQYEDEIRDYAKDLEAETKQQQFAADFFIMTETLTNLLGELLGVFMETPELAVA